MNMDVLSGIYCIENIISHKKYIGQSKDIYKRWKKHINELNSNKHVNAYLQNSWNKYGQDNFDFYIVELCELNFLNEREIYYINYYNTLDKDFGYNLKTGGQNCSSFLIDEIKDRLSNSVKLSYVDTDLKERRSESAKKYWSDPNNKQRILGENNVVWEAPY